MPISRRSLFGQLDLLGQHAGHEALAPRRSSGRALGPARRLGHEHRAAGIAGEHREVQQEGRGTPRPGPAGYDATSAGPADREARRGWPSRPRGKPRAIISSPAPTRPRLVEGVVRPARHSSGRAALANSSGGALDGDGGDVAGGVRWAIEARAWSPSRIFRVWGSNSASTPSGLGCDSRCWRSWPGILSRDMGGGDQDGARRPSGVGSLARIRKRRCRPSANRRRAAVQAAPSRGSDRPTGPKPSDAPKLESVLSRDTR